MEKAHYLWTSLTSELQVALQQKVAREPPSDRHQSQHCMPYKRADGVESLYLQPAPAQKPEYRDDAALALCLTTQDVRG